MTNPLLIYFIGFPGSGKTFFSKQLARKLQAVTYNSDALRLAMFGSHETIEKIRAEDNTRLYTDVFGAMDYAARQSLRAGHTVIYDAQQTKRSNRINLEKLAKESKATPVLIWIKTNPDVAMQRGQERAASDDSHQYSKEKMKYLIDRFDGATDLPEPKENTIIIDGEQPFSKQYRAFCEQKDNF